MNKRIAHGMIFVPLLCLLLALLAFAPVWTWQHDAQPPIEEAASEPVKTPCPLELNDLAPLVSKEIFYAPSPSTAAETTPQWRIGFVRLRTRGWSLSLCLRWPKRRANPSMGSAL